MTHMELTDFIANAFPLDDIRPSIVDTVVSVVLDTHDLTDITESDLIELCDNELFIQLYARDNQIE